jgi:hypothetical protein
MPQRLPLDERLWPAQLAIWGLALYLVGLLAGALRDGTADGSRRWLIACAMVVGPAALVSLSLPWIPPHRLRRGLVLSLCLSLLLNLSLLVGSKYVRFAPPPQRAEVVAQVAPKPEPTPAPVFPLALERDANQRAEQPELAPVATGDPQLDPREHTRATRVAAPDPMQPREDSMPDTPPRPTTTSTMMREQLADTVPRRAELEGTLSRQSLPAEPDVPETIAAPPAVPRPSADVSPDAARSDLDRQLAVQPVPPAQADPLTTSPSMPKTHRLQAAQIPREVAETDDSTAQSLQAGEALDRSELIQPRRLTTVPAIDSDLSEVPRVPLAEELQPSATARLTPQPTSPANFADQLHLPDATTNSIRLDVTAGVREPEPAADSPPVAADQSTTARQRARMAHVAPARVEVPAIPPEQPEVTERLDEAVPLTRQPSVATLEHPLIQLGDPQSAADPQPNLSSADDLRRNELSGTADAATGSAIKEIVSAVSRQPAAISQHRSITGPISAVDARVDLPRLAIRTPAGGTTPTPTRLPARQPDSLPGRGNLPETADRLATDSDDAGQPLSGLTDAVQRDNAGQRPEVVRPTGDGPNANRNLRGNLAASVDRAPSLPTDVERPEMSLPATQAGVAAAAASASSPGERRPATGAAAPSVADLPAPPGLPSATAAPGPRRASRIDIADQMPQRVAAESGLRPRTTSTGAIGPPQSTVGLPSSPVGSSPSGEPVAAASTAPGEVGIVAGSAGLRRRIDRGADGHRGVASELVPGVLPDVASASIPGDEGLQSPVPSVGRTGSRATRSLDVDLAAQAGPGGLLDDAGADVGLNSRQAQPENNQVTDSVGRFLRRPVGGRLLINSKVALPTRAFETRVNRRGDRSDGENGQPSARTEEAIERGLVYLAAQQRPDGSWSLDAAGDPPSGRDLDRLAIQSDAAATGLALLSFLGAGYHHRSDKYAPVVRDGLEFLITNQKRNGDLYIRMDAFSNESAWLYSHGIAAIALCEAYGMTQDPALREPAQLAVDFIVSSQHPERGGWRYSPGVGSDTSVSGWMVMALRSAELANLSVPGDTWQRVNVWLDLAKASADRPEIYRYNPLAPDSIAQSHGRRPTKSMTAVGLLMRMYTGWRRDDLQMKAGADYLLNNLPEVGSVRDPQRDTYYWYYATQVMFHMRGQYWDRWNGRLHELLTSSQLQTGPLAGSWDPLAPLPDRWASHAGRLYVTTLNLLSLEVYYRHLPIYEDTAR